ncbi:MAG: putative glycoside hydrolase, partial [Patescibacteria group bacterium]
LVTEYDAGEITDIKDYTGMISFDTPARADDTGGGDSRFVVNTKGCHIPDIREFIAELHQKNIYVIGRVTVMQDTIYPKAHPDAAVKRKSDGTIWKDKKGLTFIDPGATEYWDYMIDLGKASYAVGFDEINYDYIRFPSDGDMGDIKFARTGTTTKATMMKKFYQHLQDGMREAGIPISADLFGMTTTNQDDLNIGQVIEDALLYFDFVAPMVYPSHYPPGFNGWKNPNLFPYEIVKFSMERAVARANALEQKESGWIAQKVSTATSSVASSSPEFIPKGVYANKLRPWIQDFDYGKVYTEADVRAQKKAVYDAGLTSWMTWDPSNKYTLSAYDKEDGLPR